MAWMAPASCICRRVITTLSPIDRLRRCSGTPVPTVPACLAHPLLSPRKLGPVLSCHPLPTARALQIVLIAAPKNFGPLPPGVSLFPTDRYPPTTQYVRRKPQVGRAPVVTAVRHSVHLDGARSAETRDRGPLESEAGDSVCDHPHLAAVACPLVWP